MRMKQTRDCWRCGRAFLPKAGGQRYCSVECRSGWLGSSTKVYRVTEGGLARHLLDRLSSDGRRSKARKDKAKSKDEDHDQTTKERWREERTKQRRARYSQCATNKQRPNAIGLFG
jgi:hypothetical protein